MLKQQSIKTKSYQPINMQNMHLCITCSWNLVRCAWWSVTICNLHLTHQPLCIVGMCWCLHAVVDKSESSFRLIHISHEPGNVQFLLVSDQVYLAYGRPYSKNREIRSILGWFWDSAIINLHILSLHSPQLEKWIKRD